MASSGARYRQHSQGAKISKWCPSAPIRCARTQRQGHRILWESPEGFPAASPPAVRRIRRCPSRSVQVRGGPLASVGSRECLRVFGCLRLWEFSRVGPAALAIVTAMTTSTRLLPGPAPPATPRPAQDRVPDHMPNHVPDHVAGRWHPRSDDDLIAHILIVLWALATGRRPRTDVPPAQLDEHELLEFWSDPAFEEVPSR
jgi:hypothetical protein